MFLEEGVERLNSFWGDGSWKDAAYGESEQAVLFGTPEIVKHGNEEIAAAFRKRLKRRCGIRIRSRTCAYEKSEKRNRSIIFFLCFT